MTKPLVEQTADKLLKLIIERHFEVGDKLPNEYDLAQDLEVGRSTIREAVRSLAARNILEVRQGSGTYISSKRGVSEDPLGFSFIKDTRQLTSDLFELRYLLEPHIAQKVAQKASESDIKELTAIVEKIEHAMQDNNQEHSQLDVEFHAMLAKISGNLAMDNLIPVINQSIYLINENYTSPQMKESAIRSHRSILEAIVNHDGIAAYEAMQLHILLVKENALN